MRGWYGLTAALAVSLLVSGCGSTLQGHALSEGSDAPEGLVPAPGAASDASTPDAPQPGVIQPEGTLQTAVARNNPVRPFMHVKDNEIKTWTDADYQAAARKHDLMVLRVPSQKKVSLLKAANPAITVLLYYQSTFVNTRSEAWDEINKHEDWFVHDTNGRRLRRADTGWYLLNVSNAGYRKFVADRVKQKAAEFGFDGSYFDQAGEDVKLMKASRWSGTVPDSVKQNWFDWVSGFLQYVENNVGGLRIVYNSLSWSKADYQAINDSPHLGIVEQGNMEGFAHADWQDGTTQWKRDNWEYQLSRVKEAISKGKFFSAQAGVNTVGTTSDQIKRIQDYALGSYLLVADGRRVYMTFVTEGDTKPDRAVYLKAYDAPLGDPMGAYTRAGAAYVRAFATGKVVVNPDDSQTVTVSLGGTFKTLSGTSVTSVTLRPKTAAILTK